MCTLNNNLFNVILYIVYLNLLKLRLIDTIKEYNIFQEVTRRLWMHTWFF